MAAKAWSDDDGMEHSISPDRLLEFWPLKSQASLQLLPNELLSEIFSYLVPEETFVWKRLSQKDQINCQTVNESNDDDSKQQITPPLSPKANPLNFMAANSLFYHIARQQTPLKYRMYSAKITPNIIEFEGHADRALERLRGAMLHINYLTLALDVGDWGVNLEDGHVNRFLRNFERFSSEFDGPRMDKRTAIRSVCFQGNVAHEVGSKPVAPDCLLSLRQHCATALWSGEKADLDNVMWWWDDEWDDEGEGLQERGVAELLQWVRNGKMADLLRVMASFLYRLS